MGQTLSHYRILEKLGEGGMGQVYRAEDLRLHREIALKVLPSELSGSQERLERFEREAQTLAALDHPNIVHLYSVESDAGVRFLTMQLVRGQALGELLVNGGLDLDRFFEVALQIADALRVAHETGVIHRDLKPDNVMVDGEGRVKVLDFGLAKLRLPEPVEGDSQLPTQAMTQEGLVLGTVPYMSPEQVQGLPVDERTDLFSFGVLMYEMLCGRRPFEGQNTASLVSAIMRDEPVPVTEVKSEVPEGLVRIIERCLRKDPGERYASAVALAADLRQARQQRVSGRSVTASFKARTALSSPRLLKLAAVWLAVAVIVGLLLWRVRVPSGSPGAGVEITSLVVLPLQNLSGDPEQEYFVDGMTEALITDLSKISALKVISRTSAMRYKGTPKSLAEIADELGVEGVVEGSVLREGDQVGITAQLVEVATDRSLWADRYQRSMGSILALHGEIAQAIAREIQVVVAPQEQTLLAARREIDPRAYDAYLKGRFHAEQITSQDLHLARQYFQQALEIEPDFALAHHGLSQLWSFFLISGLMPPDEAAPKSMQAARAALALDESLAEAHLGVANMLTAYEWKWQEAEREFQRALELNPGLAEIRLYYSHHLTYLGHPEEGTLQIERGLELDPLNVFHRMGYGVQLMMRGRMNEAIVQMQAVLATAPGFGFGHRSLWAALNHEGRFELALTEAKAMFNAWGDPEAAALLDEGYATGGYRNAMRLAAERLVARGATVYVSPGQIAMLYDAAGEVELALEWLEKAREARDILIPYATVWPYSDDLRSHPRFVALLRSVGLPLPDSK